MCCNRSCPNGRSASRRSAPHSAQSRLLHRQDTACVDFAAMANASTGGNGLPRPYGTFAASFRGDGLHTFVRLPSPSSPAALRAAAFTFAHARSQERAQTAGAAPHSLPTASGLRTVGSAPAPHRSPTGPVLPVECDGMDPTEHRLGAQVPTSLACRNMQRSAPQRRPYSHLRPTRFRWWTEMSSSSASLPMPHSARCAFFAAAVSTCCMCLAAMRISHLPNFPMIMA